MIYRYEQARRLPQVPPLAPTDVVGREHHVAAVPDLPTLPVPPVAGDILEGRHYVCARIDFVLRGRDATPFEGRE